MTVNPKFTYETMGEFFGSLFVGEQLIILDYALQAMKRRKISTFRGDDKALKRHLHLMNRIEKHLEEKKC